MDRDEFFSNLFDEDNPRANAARVHGQVAFEGRVVRRVFTECGVRNASMGRLINECRIATGDHYLTFSWFNYTFSRFPARLFGRRIGYCGRRKMDDGTTQPLSLYQLQFADIFKPQHNVVIRTISKALHAAPDYADGQPFIFVFPIVRRMFCAHNLDIPSNPDLDTPRIQWIMQTADGAQMTVESTASLLAAIGNDWFETAQ
jgi:hypothetical protein